MATRAGTVIDGKYEILKQIGKGGMSVIYLAMDRRLNKQWAVKEIHKNAKSREGQMAVKSLLAEANLMKRLDHPALPRIVDIIESGQKIYIVMDYIEGESLDRLLREYGPQPQELVLDWAKQICDVLAYLHGQKPPVIYRDMKPANIILRPEGNIKVIDFGIAREYKEESHADTTTLGTRGYAPPEQHGGRQTDARSDIYALGMTMHHLLTGQYPGAEDYVYAPVRTWKPELSGGLEHIIDKCTALDPKDRYQSCHELLYALEHYEEEEDSYKKRQKRKLAAFIAVASITLLFGVAGIAGKAACDYVNSRDYRRMIDVSLSTPYEAKVEAYLDAIELSGADTRAYRKLLQAYQDQGRFTDEESGQFTAVFNRNREGFDTGKQEYLDLLYEAGITYFYLYSGGDQSFRARVLKAYPYFQEISKRGDEAYPYFEIAQSYRMVGEFYAEYIVNATSIREPVREEYDRLLEALEQCMEHAEHYEDSDGAYIRLTMYREISGLLTEHRHGFAETGVPQEKVCGLLEHIEEASKALSVTQQASRKLQQQILKSVALYRENIDGSYEEKKERGRQHG